MATERIGRSESKSHPEGHLVLGTSQISFELPTKARIALGHRIIGHGRNPFLNRDQGVLQLPYGASAVITIGHTDLGKIKLLFEYIRRRPGPGGEAAIRVLSGGKITHSIDERHPDGLLRMSGGEMHLLSPYMDSTVEVNGITVSSCTDVQR